LIEIVSSSSASAVGTGSGEPRARNCSYGSLPEPVSSIRMTAIPERSSGAVSSSSAASTKRNRAPEWRRM
jgi:hypothetical protein